MFVAVDRLEIACSIAHTAPGAERLVHPGHMLCPRHDLDRCAGEGQHGKTVLRPAVADRTNERGHHGPDGMDRALLLHRRHLGDRSLRGERLKPFVRGLAEVRQVDALVPRLGSVAYGVAAALLFLPDVPPASARHADNGPGLADNMPDLLDRQDLAEVLGLGLGDHGSGNRARQFSLFTVNGLEPAQGFETIRERGREKAFDISPPVEIGQKVLSVIRCVLIPDLSFPVLGTEFTHGVL